MAMNDDRLLVFKEEARNKLVKGVEILSDAVTTTLGPKGRNVAIMRQWGEPIVVHDGVTVAREVGHKDPFINMGILLVRQAAGRTNDEAGDGTTTATLLAHEIVKEGLKLVGKGINPMILRNEIYEVLPKLLDALKKMSKPVKTNDDIARVATISSADEEIGKLVADAVKKVGKDGLVTVEEGQGFEHEVYFTEGMDFSRGYLSLYFITNPDRMEAVIEEPAIIMIDNKVSLAPEIGPILEVVTKQTKDMVVVAHDVTGDALVTMAVNKRKGNINCVAVQAPLGGDDREEFFHDLSTLTGGKPIKAAEDATADLDWLGHAKKAIVTKDNTTIVEGQGDPKGIKDRVKGLQKQIEDSKSQPNKDKLEARIARLTRGVGVIRVGAKTELDMREKVERVKDAVGASEAARDEGVVVGGGVAYLLLKKAIDGRSEGESLLQSITEAPIRKLMANAGEKQEKIDKLVAQVAKKGGDIGYEVMSGKLTNLVEAGIIDPLKVVRLALENAISVATSILTTDALIAIKPKDDRRTG